MKAGLLLCFLLLTAGCKALEISPQNPQPGDKLTVSGTATPGQEVSLRSSFALHLPVVAGRYEYQSRIEVPQKPNRFAVKARDVRDMNLGVKMGIWITKGFSASGGIASVSQQDVPPGRYELKIFGQALPGVSEIEVDVSAQTAVQAGPGGEYSLIIDTAGIPAGDYKIECGGQSRTIRMGHSQSRDSLDTGSNERELQKAGSPPPVRREITPQVVSWYARQIDLNPDDDEQYREAEERLRALVKGDYWRVIGRGDPLTEQAGDCQQEYCLVRGIDACTICREKEMLACNAQPNNWTAGNGSQMKEKENRTNVSLDKKSMSFPDDKGFIGKILNWIANMLAHFSGG